MFHFFPLYDRTQSVCNQISRTSKWRRWCRRGWRPLEIGLLSIALDLDSIIDRSRRVTRENIWILITIFTSPTINRYTAKGNILARGTEQFESYRWPKMDGTEIAFRFGAVGKVIMLLKWSIVCGWTCIWLRRAMTKKPTRLIDVLRLGWPTTWNYNQWKQSTVQITE